MDAKEEQLLGAEVARHWYYVSKGRALRSFLGDVRGTTLLDVGAGSGVFARQLLEAGVCDQATCIDPAYADEHEEVYHGQPLRFLRFADKLPVDLLLMMDVLEHVDDDLELLETYTERLAPGGHVLISVPAFQFLWSGHDVFLEHRRRYVRKEIEALLQRAGLSVLRCRYFFGGIFPAVATLRILGRVPAKLLGREARSDLRPASDLANWLLVRAHDLERETLFRVNRWAGLTLFCLAKR